MNPKPDKIIPALYGGLIMAVISTVPVLSLVNCLCCAGILFGGFMAVFFYKNNFTPDTPPYTSGDCMAVGVMAGVISAFASTILSLMFMALFGRVTEGMLMNMLRNLNLPEQNLQMIEESLQGAKTGLAIFIELFERLIIHGLFGLLGGLIGFSIFKPKASPLPPPPPAAPAV
jgi:hypothetical protein